MSEDAPAASEPPEPFDVLMTMATVDKWREHIANMELIRWSRDTTATDRVEWFSVCPIRGCGSAVISRLMTNGFGYECNVGCPAPLIAEAVAFLVKRAKDAAQHRFVGDMATATYIESAPLPDKFRREVVHA